ncbi:uncharacterized protein [Lepeophtheirus salmonis]|uniref:uncharacterized protein isoform X1 n=2 Tax=Lepeophtheirus salmonis TaxID=72036 RepID=UPI001AE3DD26|nr:probable serine/threonine-protein kinase DDB_G0276181 [Lepeophtheirus salmonis]
MVDTRNNFRFVEVVNHDDRENYTKLVLKKVYTLPVDKDDNAPTQRQSRVEQMRKNFEKSNGFSYLRPSLFTPKPFSSSTNNLHNNNLNQNLNNTDNKNNNSINHQTLLNNNEPIYENKPVPRPVVPPKPRYKKPPPLPIIDNDRPKCASPVPELLQERVPNTPPFPKKQDGVLQTMNMNNQQKVPTNNNINNNIYSNILHSSSSSPNSVSNINDNHQQNNNNNNKNTSQNGTSSSPPFPRFKDVHVITPKIQPVLSSSQSNKSVTKSPQYKELFEQKSQIRERLFSKIEVLREEERELSNEKVEIDFCARRFYVRLLDKNESDADKFSHFIQEIQQITKLKSGLILRLAKLEHDGHLKYTSEEFMKKRAQLQGQILEAENLQKYTDRRRKVQDRIIQNHFSNEDILEFTNMIDNLIRVVRDQREMEHKITLGNEKLRALDDIG